MTNARNAVLVRRKFGEFLLPTVFTSMAISLASVVDGVIVGNLLGGEALAAIGLSSPVILALNAMFFLFAVGGITGASRARGERDERRANSFFTMCVVGGVALSALYALGVTAFSAPISLKLAQGDIALAGMTRAYIISSIWTGPFLTFSLTMAQFWKSDGSPKAATLVSLVANCVNLLLDYTFIRFFNSGIAGAGLSTTLGYVVGALVTVSYLRSPKRGFKFARVSWTSFKRLWEIMQNGAFRSLQSLSGVAQTLVVNGLIVSIFGSAGMTAMTVCINAQMIAMIFSGGTSETLLPIISTLSGEKDYFGIRSTLKTATFTLLAISACVMTFFIAAPQVMGALFGVAGEGAIVTVSALRMYALSIAFFTLNQLLQNYFGSIGQKQLATIMPIVDSFVLLVSYALLFSRFNGQLIWLSYLCAEATTTLLVCLASRVLRKKQPNLSGLFLLPREEAGEKWEATISAGAQSATSLSQQAIDFCLAQGISSRLSTFLGMCVEECCMNTAEMNLSRKAPTIDVLMSIAPGEILLRLRDDGAIFNPISYADDDALPHERIDLVKKLADKAEYSHNLGFNTTILTLSAEQARS